MFAKPCGPKLLVVPMQAYPRPLPYAAPWREPAVIPRSRRTRSAPTRLLTGQSTIHRTYCCYNTLELQQRGKLRTEHAHKRIQNAERTARSSGMDGLSINGGTRCT
jgi:hypothetical protein